METLRTRRASGAIVNEDGNPAGTTGPITKITVLDGYVLYVTDHLEWNGLGSKANSTTCGTGGCGTATQQITITGTVISDPTNPNNFTTDVCRAGAVGRLK